MCYKVVKNRHYFEIRDRCDNFISSADSYSEALEEIDLLTESKDMDTTPNMVGYSMGPTIL